MENRSRVQVHDACVVPFRHTASGVQFCLISPIADSRWEFPKASLDHQGRPLATLLEEAAAAVGLRGHLHQQQPLDRFVAARGSESREMTAYLLQVIDFDESLPTPNGYRRLWCLSEEARIRIRRKPLRRLIDLAAHSVCAPMAGRSRPAAEILVRPKT